MKLINLVKVGASVFALGCFADASTSVAQAETVSIASFQGTLDTFKPQQLNDAAQKAAIKQSISDLKASAQTGYGHFEKKVALIEQLIQLSDAGKIMPPVSGVAVTVRPIAGINVIDIFSLSESDLQISGVAETLLGELKASRESYSYQTQPNTRKVVDFWFNKTINVLNERYRESAYPKAMHHDFWVLVDYVAEQTGRSASVNTQTGRTDRASAETVRPSTRVWGGGHTYVPAALAHEVWRNKYSDCEFPWEQKERPNVIFREEVRQPVVPTDSIRERVVRVCQNPGITDYLIDNFVKMFSEFLEINGCNWDRVSDGQITTHLNTFVRTGNVS